MNYLYNHPYRKVVMGCLCVVLLLSSCKKFVDIGGSPKAITTEQSFSDSANANAAIVGLYINIIGTGGTLNIGNGAVGIYTGLMADEYDVPVSNSAGKDFFANLVQPTNPANGTLWSNGYKYIYQANACIEGATASTGLTTAMKNKIVGEALFIRAHLHFTLMNMYGRVPLVLVTDFRTTSAQPRTDTAVVYRQIIDDLTRAYQLLQTDPMAITKLRPNKYTVQALLARVYLYRKQWADAEASANIVLNANYGLVKNLDSAFLTNNREAIWQIPASFAATETPEGNNMIPSSATATINYMVTDPLLNSFEAGDKRKTQWTQTRTATNITYPYKYKLRNPTVAGGINPQEAHTEYRLSEQFLIRAEARAWQGKLDDARKDLDTIRTRAGLDKTTATLPGDIITAVLKERRVELFGEWGHRFFDLKRTNTIDAVMTAVKPTTWRTNAALFPIPYNETLLNPNLEPNP